ncbi:uncharacterized protein LOC119298853 [Triticum dicoccoides]|uniref:uncharacterized protein LOC119298853 n=1 Tax=Triticum dicoccoides TaxID=85692 RepID=UPI00188FBF0B|nr:uncharacterized protein LOC119298853 [Triticum dicoccoides]
MGVSSDDGGGPPGGVAVRRHRRSAPSPQQHNTDRGDSRSSTLTASPPAPLFFFHSGTMVHDRAGCVWCVRGDSSSTLAICQARLLRYVSCDSLCVGYVCGYGCTSSCLSFTHANCDACCLRQFRPCSSSTPARWIQTWF